MRALTFTRYGGPDAMELRHIPVPTPGPGEVLIRVRAAGLNPIAYMCTRVNTRSPALTLVTPDPLSATMPESSFPATMGVGTGRSLAAVLRASLRIDPRCRFAPRCEVARK
jgi:NADPH:quinone reductase-like Zn-dependent oxidoreductase